MDINQMNENAPRPRTARGGTTILVIIMAMIALAGTGAWLYQRESSEVAGSGGSTSAATLLADYGVVPPVEMTERNGKQVSLGDLRGKIWVANFIFTKCAGTCQMMSAKLADMQKSLRKAGDVSLVSISVDPKNDTPERLKEFADRYNADPDRWLFLTTDNETVQDLAKNTFKLAVQEGTDPNEPIIHSTRYVLVDTRGSIRGYYDSKDAESHQKLLTDIGLLMREGA